MRDCLGEAGAACRGLLTVVEAVVTVASEEREEEKRRRRMGAYIDKTVCFDPVCAIYALSD